jgi:hypothetical protein
MPDEPRVFEYQVESRHGDPDNQCLAVSWRYLGEPFTVTMSGPPFGIFTYAVLASQLAELCSSASERGLRLGRVRGRFRVTTADRVVRDLDGELWLTLRAGAASPEDLALLAGRMRDCPVSRNLTAARRDTRLHLETTAAAASPLPARVSPSGLPAARPELPLVARLMVEVRSDGTHTVARGGVEDTTTGERTALEVRGTTPLSLMIALARSLPQLPGLARRAARALLPGERK